MIRTPKIDPQEIANKMPSLSLTTEELEILSEIQLNGYLRPTKPINSTPAAQFVWREIVARTSPYEKYQVIPPYPEFNISGIDMDECLKLRNLILAIVDTVPDEKLHGLNHWNAVFGNN